MRFIGCCLSVALTATVAQAQVIKSDCSADEQKTLKTSEFAHQFVLSGSLTAQDCTPVKVADKEILLISVVASTSAGLESYIALFERKGFSSSAAAIFKSPALGFDTFPILVEGAQRLAFVHPASDKNRLVLYMSIQNGPAVTRLARWEYQFDKKTLEQTNRTWTFDAGIIAKIYEDRDTLRALIDVRSVEL